MKEKIASALKTEYANLGLSERAIDGVASFLEKTVTEESGIADAIKQEGVKVLLKSFQGDADSARNRYATLQKELEDYKKAHPDTKPDDDKGKGGDEEPQWAKDLREQNAKILEAQAKREKADKDAATFASVKAALEKAGCSNAGILNLTLKGFALGENESESDAVTRLTEEYNANVKATFGEGGAAPAGGGKRTPDTKAERDARNAYLEKRGLLPKEEKKS